MYIFQNFTYSKFNILRVRRWKYIFRIVLKDRIQEWCNHWCMILNPNKTTAIVVSRSRTVNAPHGNLVLSGVSIWASPNLDIFRVKFYMQQTHLRTTCAWYCDPCLSMNWYFEVGEACISGHLGVASLLLCICSPNPWVLFSGVWVYCWMSTSASQSPAVYSVARLCPDQIFSSLYHRRHAAALCMLYKANSN